MKKLLALLLVMAMSLSLLVGCGGSNGDSDKGNSANKEEHDDWDDEEDRGIVTKTYDVTDFNTGETMVCEITYDSSMIENAEEIFEDVEPVTNISEMPDYFYPVEGGAEYEVVVIPGPSAQQFYEGEKESYSRSDHYTSAVFSELTTETYGTIDVKTYTLELLWLDDGEEKDLDYQYWMLEFEEGIMRISTYGDIEDFTYDKEGLNDLLIDVTLNGNAPKTSTGADNDTTGNAGTMSASEWLTPTIKIDGVVYTFPMEAQELVDNGWTMINNFPVGATPGANAGINFTKGDLTLFTNVSSTTGLEQPMEEGEVCSISYSEEYGNITDVPMEFPGGIALGMSKAEVEQILPSEFEYNAEYQYFKYVWQTEKGKMDIKIYLSDDGSVVEEIGYTCWTE